MLEFKPLMRGLRDGLFKNNDQNLNKQLIFDLILF